MRISRSLDYALRSLIYLGIHGGGDLARIAHHQRIPQAYLAKVMNRLVRNGIVRSTMGREGGYALRRVPEQITLHEVFEAVEGKVQLFDCYHGQEECYFLDRHCTQKQFWEHLEGEIRRVLEQTTLADIMPKFCLAEDIHDVETATAS